MLLQRKEIYSEVENYFNMFYSRKEKNPLRRTEEDL